MQGDENRVHRPLRPVVALIQHRPPGIEQTSRNGGIGDLVPQIIGHSAVRIDALKVGPHLFRQEEGGDMKIFIVSRREFVAPRLRLHKGRPLQRS